MGIFAAGSQVYRLQGVDINDKHIEVIIRQMLRKVKLMIQRYKYASRGLVDMFDFEAENARVEAEGLRPATEAGAAGYYESVAGNRCVLVGGIFPETTGIDRSRNQGQVDPLVRLKKT